MDSYHSSLIKELNPAAPGLALASIDHCLSFSRALSQMEVHPALVLWSARMMKSHLAKTGRDYVVYGHCPSDFLAALTCRIYGMDASHWPKKLGSGYDLNRAFLWERGGQVPPHIGYGEHRYYPIIAGGNEFTNYFEAQLGNALTRTGLSSTGVWTAGAAKIVGNVVRPTTWNDTLFEVVEISGTGTTDGATEPTWTTTPGDEIIDNAGANQVIWQASKIGLLKRALYLALFTAAPGETGGGTETVYANYTRVRVTPTDANWNASITNGVSGRNDNVSAIPFGIPGDGPHTLTDFALMSRSANGNFFMFSPLTDPKTINNGDPAPSFPAGALDIDIS